MWKTGILGLAAVLALGAGTAAWAQNDAPPGQDPYRPDDPRDREEEDLTPEKAMAMLKEVEGLMGRSEEYLNDSSRGKALTTEAELLKKLEGLLKEEEKNNPELVQKQILEKIERLMKKSEKSQGDAIERMKEIIRKAKS